MKNSPYRLKLFLRWAILVFLLFALMGIVWLLGGEPLPQTLLPTQTTMQGTFDENLPVVVVGIDNAYPPYEYLQDGNPAGFNVDLIRMVGNLMGFNVEIRAAPWEEMRQQLETGEVDMLAGMYASPQRHALVDFSSPHTLVKSGLLVRSDSGIESFEDLQGGEVVVQSGDIMHDLLLQMDKSDFEVVTVESPQEALQQLSAGMYDAALLSSQYQALYFMDVLNIRNLQQIESGIEVQSYCFAVQEGDTALLLQLNEGLNLARASGQLVELDRFWFEPYQRRTMVEQFRPYLVALGLVLLALSIALLWTWSLSEEVKVQTRRLTESEERYRRLVELSPEAILVIVDGKIAFLNPAGEKLFGIAEVALMVGKPVKDFIRSPECRVDEKVVQTFTERLFMRPNGSQFDAAVSMSPVDYLDAPAELWIVRDITEEKRSEAQLRYSATHDILTDLPNRVLFNERIQEALQRAARSDSVVAILFLDLDDFKAVNDAFSHRGGDLLLRNIARRLCSHTRGTDMVARIGGDEFAILCEDLQTPENAARIAQNLIEAMEMPFYLEGQMVYCTFSVGIALYPENGSSADSLLQNADISMYRAKHSGKNSYQFFSPDMALRVRQRLEQIQILRRSIDENRFCLYYQPQVDVRTGNVVGAEALLRWNSEQEGVVPACEFITLAEESGLILALSEWILRSACLQAQEWRRSGLMEICVAVNLSPRQLEQPGLLNMIEKVLEESGLPPSFLELELTEGTVIQNVKHIEGVLHALRNMGVRLALDDFGTGYSSLSYVSSLPLDTIKIDRFFSRNVLLNRDDAVVVTGMISIVEDLRKKVIIEGVETKEQLAFFEKGGAHIIQGYYFSPAVPPDEFARYAQKN